MADDGTAEAAPWPLPKFHFIADLGDGKPMSFSEVSGLESEAGAIEYRHSDSRVFSQIKMPGLKKAGNVTLKRGVSSRDSSFLDWVRHSQPNPIDRRTLILSLLDEKGAPTMVWTLTNAWPTKMTGPSLNSEGNDVVIETLEIAYETMSVTTSGAEAG